MNKYEIIAHPSQTRHWFVNGALVAGGKTPKEAKIIFEQSCIFVDAALIATAHDVRAEAERRMMAVLGARDARHLRVLVSNAAREEVRLLRRGRDNWTAEEAAKVEELEQIDMAIETIRAASNALESNPPLDYADEKYWPHEEYLHYE